MGSLGPDLLKGEEVRRKVWILSTKELDVRVKRNSGIVPWMMYNGISLLNQCRDRGNHLVFEELLNWHRINIRRCNRSYRETWITSERVQPIYNSGSHLHELRPFHLVYELLGVSFLCIETLDQRKRGRQQFLFLLKCLYSLLEKTLELGRRTPYYTTLFCLNS